MMFKLFFVASDTCLDTVTYCRIWWNSSRSFTGASHGTGQLIHALTYNYVAWKEADLKEMAGLGRCEFELVPEKIDFETVNHLSHPSCKMICDMLLEFGSCMTHHCCRRVHQGLTDRAPSFLCSLLVAGNLSQQLETVSGTRWPRHVASEEMAEPVADHQAACSHAGLCLTRNVEIVQIELSIWTE